MFSIRSKWWLSSSATATDERYRHQAKAGVASREIEQIRSERFNYGENSWRWPRKIRRATQAIVNSRKLNHLGGNGCNRIPKWGKSIGRVQWCSNCQFYCKLFAVDDQANKTAVLLLLFNRGHLINSPVLCECFEAIVIVSISHFTATDFVHYRYW